MLTPQALRDVQQLPSNDEDRPSDYTMTGAEPDSAVETAVSLLRQPDRVHMSAANMFMSSDWACPATLELLANVGIRIIWCCFKSLHFCSQHVHCLRNAGNSQCNLSLHIISNTALATTFPQCFVHLGTHLVRLASICCYHGITKVLERQGVNGFTIAIAFWDLHSCSAQQVLRDWQCRSLNYSCSRPHEIWRSFAWKTCSGRFGLVDAFGIRVLYHLFAEQGVDGEVLLSLTLPGVKKLLSGLGRIILVWSCQEIV